MHEQVLARALRWLGLAVLTAGLLISGAICLAADRVYVNELGCWLMVGGGVVQLVGLLRASEWLRRLGCYLIGKEARW